MTAVPRLILRIRSLSASALRLSEKAALNAAGKRTAMTEMTSSDELSWAAYTLQGGSAPYRTRRKSSESQDARQL